MTEGDGRKWMLAAVICLAPGGFILGASLAANHLRKKRARAAEAAQAEHAEADAAEQADGRDG